jgi:hypothetical protein
LTRPRGEVAEKLQARIELGHRLKSTKIQSEEQLEAFKRERQIWRDFNIEYLHSVFDNGAVAEEFEQTSQWAGLWGGMTLGQRVESIQTGTDRLIAKLQSVLERLELFTVAANVEPVSILNEPEFGSEVFIVHGHDEGAKDAAARFISVLGLTPIILHEQPDGGNTVIEKFERHAGTAGFAIGLLTADDLGRPKAGGDETLHPRARQNVILEVGYFLGKLGRNRVRILYKRGVLEILCQSFKVPKKGLNNGREIRF